MKYLELTPHPALASFVACYWMLQSEEQEEIKFSTILPDGCTDIIFNFGGPLISKSHRGVYINALQSFVVGNMTRPVLSKAQDRYDVFSIRFKAGGLYAFIQQPLNEFTDHIVDLSLFKSFNHWHDRLSETTLLNRRCELLDTLLLSQLKPAHAKSVSSALNALWHSKGVARIGDLSKGIGVSQKQLERQFATIVGITPKQMARIIQFQHMTTLIRAKGEESLLQLAIDAGYTDHAHLTKSFKEFAGLTPQQFLQQ